MFCHFYQIPYLEDNAPKTTKNAVKIYLRMIQDGHDLHHSFKGTKLEKVFLKMSQQDLSEEFDPFNLRDKWLRFFRGYMSRAELDTNRVLKNVHTSNQAYYIDDYMLTFNDNQLLRALYI